MSWRQWTEQLTMAHFVRDAVKVKLLVLWLITVIAVLLSPEAYAETVGPELICNKKEIRSRATVCIDATIFDASGNEIHVIKPILYGRCPKGYTCTWGSAIDVTRR